ncbi:ubiquinol oxidase subunit II [Rhizobium sp. TRM95796]|uniref:ubiquinol oxidase subunit II n=1 Tax=Rhizobium sp. TRM95796 TaxID=2979862 RepID=UPI0021E83B06|nr:ubiquinol oxidase subunit II [Rhizobium sp. TRM95796]MCV3767883.1 ubiquinol oxidase subunit II [Rhizobium sp. TRM95796]
MQKLLKFSCHLLGLTMLLALAGCDMVVMSPSGDIAMQQRDLILVSTGLMLLIIIPVIILTLYFAWHYRRSNEKAVYAPDWHHSMRLEVVIWAAPLMIIIALGAITWISTHKLDPYRPLDRIDASRPVPADVKPLEVQVVALDWKWLFFYPEQGVATVNEMAAPIDRPITFTITGTSVMNSFYIPALAGQIYAMPGMQTKLHAVINKEGVFEGFSANYSGSGFSHMRFKFHALGHDGFDQWVATVKSRGTMLNMDAYFKLEKPSEKVPPTYYAGFQPDLFHRIVNLCTAPGSVCVDEVMHIDRMGGGGKEPEVSRDQLRYDNRYTDFYEKFHYTQGPHKDAEALNGLNPTFPATGNPAKSEEAPEGTATGAPEPAPAEAAPSQGAPDGAQPQSNDPAPAQINP